jgi:hypothetical protein
MIKNRNTITSNDHLNRTRHAYTFKNSLRKFQKLDWLFHVYPSHRNQCSDRSITVAPPLPTKKEENAVSAASAPNSCWTAQGELWASGDMKTAPLSLEAISAIAVEERTLTYAA